MENQATTIPSSQKRSRDASLSSNDPRSCALCIKRIFQQTFLCSANQSKIDQEKAKQETKKAKKPPRPLNSYLKIVLDDVTMDRLHDMSVQLGKVINSLSNEKEEEVQQQQVDSGATETTIQSTRKRKGRPLKYRSRSRNSLHFTFFFGGEVLCSMPPDELTDWHSRIQERLAKSNFFLDSDPFKPPPSEEIVVSSSTRVPPIGPEEEMEKEEYWFRIKELSLFPPRRNPYLIVALLEASPSWHTLHNDIRSIALGGKSESLKSLASRDNGADWIPHITLGNLYGGNKEEKNALSTMLQDYPLSSSELTTENPEQEEDIDAIGVRCVTMGGPVPQQVELDWTFRSRK